MGYYISMSTKKKPTKRTNKATVAKARKNGAWFVATRWSYIPVSPQGWALYAPYTMLLLLILVVASYQETVAEGVVIAIPGLIAITMAMQWLAAHKS